MTFRLISAGVVIAIIASVIIGPDAFFGNKVGIGTSKTTLAVDGVPMPTAIKAAGTQQALIGGGMRMKWGFKVYVVGFYSHPNLVASLKKKYDASKGANLQNLASDFGRGKPARTVLLRFQRSVAASDISDALGEALKPKVGAETSDKFQKFILALRDFQSPQTHVCFQRVCACLGKK